MQKGKKKILSSYKLIIFKNILAKVLKKYVTNIIFKAMGEYRLLFWNYMKVRCKRSTLLAVELLNFCV